MGNSLTGRCNHFFCVRVFGSSRRVGAGRRCQTEQRVRTTATAHEE
ncbi:hypothetical protein SUDANB108_01623 [Streptomyces sp. enrichment culture]